MNIDDFIGVIQNAFDNTVTKIKPTDTFKDYEGWDSLTLLLLATNLEEEYGITISSEEFDKFQTIQDMFEYVNSNK